MRADEMIAMGRLKLLGYAADAWRVGHGGPGAVAARQRARLANLVRFARARSPFYHELYRHLPATITALGELPPVTKPQLMAHFDEWVTDPAVTRAGVEPFLADKTLVGRPYLRRYSVWTSSGITGVPGTFLHDADAVALYRALTFVRGVVPWMTPRRLWASLRRGGRVATMTTIGGHYVTASLMEGARQSHPWPFNRVRSFSVFKPLTESVQALNAFRPTLLLGNASILTFLAREQAAGRLAIRPTLVGSGAEWLSPVARRVIEAAFNCRVRENYGAAEFPRAAWECRHGSLHLSADWVILEPVDERYRPVPAGQSSYTALLTNLANRVQPLIRYDLGDSITLDQAPCPCGSPRPVLRVEGRRDDTLWLRTLDGQTVPVLPVPLTYLVHATPGVYRCQVIQTGPTTLSVCLEAASGASDQQVWHALRHSLRKHLSAHGLPHVRVEWASEPPGRHPVSGKFRWVWSELA